MPDTILVDRAEYEALKQRADLLERELDARDAAFLDAAASGRTASEYLDAASVRRLLMGDHPVAVWRAARGMSPTQLARLSGVGRSYVVEIESGRKPGSVAAYVKLAAALGIQVDDLLPHLPA